MAKLTSLKMSPIALSKLHQLATFADAARFFNSLLD